MSGKAADMVVAVTGKTEYNVELRSGTYGVYGVISEDGKKMTFKDMVGVGWMEWITKEEAAAIEAARDPIEAPPHPYKEQPGNLGKFLWITGPSGTGKSTSAQLLARNAGYVYYEGDCFRRGRNPYIDVYQPTWKGTLGQSQQKLLKGAGLAKRMEVSMEMSTAYMKMVMDKEFDEEALVKYYECICDDIKRERERIGGDWAVAFVVNTRRLRDLVRSRLGPDLTFVVLDIAWEDLEERVTSRWDETSLRIKMVSKKALWQKVLVLLKTELGGDLKFLVK